MCCYLSQSLGSDHVMDELNDETSTELHFLDVDHFRLGEGGEETAHAEAVIQIAHCIEEAGVPNAKG